MIAAIIQARVGSTRFPNKIFAPLADKPLLWHVVDRLKRSTLIERIVVATTTNALDDRIFSWAAENGVACFRGEEEDVLGRFAGAARMVGASTIVRITADDPFKDPQIIDSVIEKFFQAKADFAYNNNPPSYPEGLDVEVFSMAALVKANEQSNDPYEREHVTQYFYRHPAEFKQVNHSYGKDISHLRWTLDTQDDYRMVKLIYDKLYKDGEIFLFDDILDLIAHHPEIAEMNASVSRSAMYKKA